MEESGVTVGWGRSGAPVYDWPGPWIACGCLGWMAEDDRDKGVEA
jgi:hypothetical protein